MKFGLASGTVLRVGFALLMVLVAIQLVRKAMSEQDDAGSPQSGASHGNRPTSTNNA